MLDNAERAYETSQSHNAPSHTTQKNSQNTPKIVPSCVRISTVVDKFPVTEVNLQVYLVRPGNRSSHHHISKERGRYLSSNPILKSRSSCNKNRIQDSHQGSLPIKVHLRPALAYKKPFIGRCFRCLKHYSNHHYKQKECLGEHRMPKAHWHPPTRLLVHSKEEI